MGTVSLTRLGTLDAVPSPQFDCQATVIPEDSHLDANFVIDCCRRNDSVRTGLEGDEDEEFFCVQFVGRFIEVYTESALRASL